MKKGVRDAAWLKIKLTISREGVCGWGGGGGAPKGANAAPVKSASADPVWERGPGTMLKGGSVYSVAPPLLLYSII